MAYLPLNPIFFTPHIYDTTTRYLSPTPPAQNYSPQPFPTVTTTRVAPSINPADFPCVDGTTPSIGFSHMDADGRVQTDSIKFNSTTIMDGDAQLATYKSLYKKCLGDASDRGMLAKLNCAPKGPVQSCASLYVCSSAASINGTVMGTAVASTAQGGVSASFVASRPTLGNDTVLECFVQNLEPAMQDVLTAKTKAEASAAPAASAKFSSAEKFSKAQKMVTILAITSAALAVVTAVQ